MIKDVLEKLDTILDEPGESSFIFMEKAYEALEDGYCKEALDHFKDVVRKAIQGKLQYHSFTPESWIKKANSY